MIERPILGADELADDLRRIGITTGDGVMVHTALSAVGEVIGGPRGLIEALIAAVGPSGLIAMPGFSRDAYDPTDGRKMSEAMRSRLRDQVPGFDPSLSNTRQNGAVPEAFRSWPGVVRSPHPTSSLLLFGPDAAEWAEPHDPLGWPTGPDSPWGRLGDRPAMKILLIGVLWNRCSALHAAESRADRRRTTVRHFKPSRGAAWVKAPDVEDDNGRLFPALGQAFEAAGGVTIGRLGGAETRLCGYRALLDFGAAWFDANSPAPGRSEAIGDEM
ncbi:MAG: AAC(3) family N-acetyltransferase [Pseudomonadota bacterium]